MSANHAVAVVAALAAAALAGCVGGSTPASVGPATSVSASDAGLGAIAGVVTDESLLLIGDAEVYLTTAKNFTTRTGADGSFLLVNVPPGSHTLVASKFGYESGTKSVAVGAGETVRDVHLQVTQIPPPAEPETLTFIENGFLSCNTSNYGFQTERTQFCGLDPANKPAFVFEVDLARGLIAVVLELGWKPSSGLTSEKLRHALWKEAVCTSTPPRCDPKDMYIYGEVEGKSPLKKVYGNATQPLRANLPADEKSLLTAFALIPTPKGPTDLYLVLQQPVTHYVSVFYNEAPADDYTLLRGAA